MDCLDNIEDLWWIIVVIWVIAGRIIRLMKGMTEGRPQQSPFALDDQYAEDEDGEEAYGEDEVGEDAVARELERRLAEAEAERVARRPLSTRPRVATWQEAPTPTPVWQPSEVVQEAAVLEVVEDTAIPSWQQSTTEVTRVHVPDAYDRTWVRDAYSQAIGAEVALLDLSPEGIRDAVILHELLKTVRT